MGDTARGIDMSTVALGADAGISERQMCLIYRDNQHLRSVNKALIAERQRLNFEIDEGEIFCSELAVSESWRQNH